MRTPGHDEELALGFLRSEGIPAVAARPPPTWPRTRSTSRSRAASTSSGCARNFYTSSSCGVCGKGALEAVAVEAPRVESDLTVPAALVSELPDRLRAAQPTFAATGGLHATGLFDADGSAVVVREDVGRHNAFDKVVGRAFLDGSPPARRQARLRQRPALVRARAEGGRGRRARRRGRGRALDARRRAGARPRDHALRLRPRRPRQRLLGALEDHVTFAVPAEAYDRFVGRYSYALCRGARGGGRDHGDVVGPGRRRRHRRGHTPHRRARGAENGWRRSTRRSRSSRRCASGSPAPTSALPRPSRSRSATQVFDAALAQLVVNFMSDPERGVAEMRRVTRSGGVVAACVWDYAGEMTILRAFWEAAEARRPETSMRRRRRAQGDAVRPARRAGEASGAQAGLDRVEEGEIVVAASYERLRRALAAVHAGRRAGGRLRRLARPRGGRRP